MPRQAYRPGIVRYSFFAEEQGSNRKGYEVACLKCGRYNELKFLKHLNQFICMGALCGKADQSH